MNRDLKFRAWDKNRKLNKDVVIGIAGLLISISFVQFNEYLLHTEPFLTEMLMRLSFGLGIGAGVFAFISAILFADIYKRIYEK